MKITRLEKTANYNDHSVKVSLDVEITKEELENIGYEGLDLLPDYLISDLLVAVGRKYSGSIEDGKIKLSEDEVAGLHTLQS